MKKLGLYIILLLINGFSVFAQDAIFTTTSGEINFNSDALLENIEAKNNNVISILNTNNKEVVVRMVIDQFQFSNQLMQEHFNSIFMESDRYPTASFKGKINESIDFIKPGTYNVSATGTLYIHGVDRKRTLYGKMTITNEGILLTTQFNVLLAQHKITIPELVFNKIADSILVTTSFNFLPYNKGKVKLSAL